MCEQVQVRLVASGGRISSVGLAFAGHRELSMRAITPEASRHAEAVILSLAAHVVDTGAQLRPGDAFAFAGGAVRIELGGPGHLEVVSCGASRPERCELERRDAEVAASRWWVSTC